MMMLKRVNIISDDEGGQNNDDVAFGDWSFARCEAGVQGGEG